MNYSLNKSVLISRSQSNDLNVINLNNDKIYTLTKINADILEAISLAPMSRDNLVTFLVEAKKIPRNTADKNLNLLLSKLQEIDVIVCG